MDSRLCLGPCSYARLKKCLAAGLRGRGISGTNLYYVFVDSIERLNRMAIEQMGFVFLVGLPRKRRTNDFGNLAMLLRDWVRSMVCSCSVDNSQGVRSL